MTGINFANLFQQGGPFDIGGSFAQGYGQGQQLRQQAIVQNALGEISRRAQAGDLQGAASIALQIGDSQTANQLLTQQREREQLTYERARQARADQLAGIREIDTPAGKSLVQVLPGGGYRTIYQPRDLLAEGLGAQPTDLGAGAPPPPPTALPSTAAAPQAPPPAAPQGVFGPRVAQAGGQVYAPSAVAGGKTDLGAGAGFPQPAAAAQATPQSPFADIPQSVRNQALGWLRAGRRDQAQKIIDEYRNQGMAKPEGTLEKGQMWERDPTSGKYTGRAVDIPGYKRELTESERGRVGLITAFQEYMPNILDVMDRKFGPQAEGDPLQVNARSELATGWGEAGEMGKQIQTGVDVLERMLTGAAMNKDEIRNYSFRYLPSPTDPYPVMRAKIQRLSTELGAINDLITSTGGGIEATREAVRQHIRQQVQQGKALGLWGGGQGAAKAPGAPAGVTPSRRPSGTVSVGNRQLQWSIE